MMSSWLVVSMMACVLGGASPTDEGRHYHWDSSNAPRGLAAPTLTQLAGTPALRFARERNTRVELGQGRRENLKLRGPFTIQTVISLHTLPPTKVALISKWRTGSGGRSYELGITPFGWLFFTVSASGKWDRHAAELLSTRMLEVGTPYHVTAVFQPGRRMALYINGRLCGQRTRDVPRAVFDSATPVWLGNRCGSPSLCGFDGLMADVGIACNAKTEATVRADAAAWQLPEPSADSESVALCLPVDLDAVRTRTRRWYERLAAPGMPYGAYRLTPGRPPDMYASADIAWIRWMMDDLDLTTAQRQQWIQFIQAQQNVGDGTYRHITGHCPAHAFCHATGALNMLGGAHRYVPSFLDRYRKTAGIPEWLDHIDWVRQWGASHDIWGAGLPLACSADTPAAWRAALFQWLDHEVDPKTGFWRRDTPARSPLESLGGAFHIWPIYAAMRRPLPYPNKVIDHVLGLQQADGSFDRGFGYGNMDGVWVLQYLTSQVDYRRRAVVAALETNLRGLVQLYNQRPARFFADAHGTESRVATLAILRDGLPDRFRVSRPWRDPWHVRRLFEIHVEDAADR